MGPCLTQNLKKVHPAPPEPCPASKVKWAILRLQTLDIGAYTSCWYNIIHHISIKRLIPGHEKHSFFKNMRNLRSSLRNPNASPGCTTRRPERRRTRRSQRIRRRRSAVNDGATPCAQQGGRGVQEQGMELNTLAFRVELGMFLEVGIDMW